MAEAKVTRAQKLADPSDCNYTALRRATRRVAQLYDGMLAPLGMRATQFIILATLQKHGPQSVNDLAETLVLDRTTTGKNLQPLERDGYVEVTKSPLDGRMRIAALTTRGLEAFETAHPYWDRAQKGFEGTNGKAWSEHLRTRLGEMKIPEEIPASNQRAK